MLVKIFTRKSFRQRNAEEMRLGFEKRVSNKNGGGSANVARSTKTSRKICGARAAVDYLLGKNRDRAGAKLLRGFPELSIKIAEDASRKFSNPYTVGCLAIEETDLPDTQIKEIMDSFEEVVFAGVAPENRNILWVEHRDKRNLELNFFIPNIELSTGKRFQPYFHKADKTLFADWRTMINQKYGLSSPDDPSKRQDRPLNKNLPKNVRELANQVHTYVSSAVQRGEVKNRQQVIDLINTDFKEYGIQVVRISKKSISINNPEGGRNIRLKGIYYEYEFNRTFETEKPRGTESRGGNTAFRSEGSGARYTNLSNQRTDSGESESHQFSGGKLSEISERLFKGYGKRYERNIRQYKQTDYSNVVQHQFRNTGESLERVPSNTREDKTRDGELQGQRIGKGISPVVVECRDNRSIRSDTDPIGSIVIQGISEENSPERVQHTDKANQTELRNTGRASVDESRTGERNDVHLRSSEDKSDVLHNGEVEQGKTQRTQDKVENASTDMSTPEQEHQQNIENPTDPKIDDEEIGQAWVL